PASHLTTALATVGFRQVVGRAGGPCDRSAWRSHGVGSLALSGFWYEPGGRRDHGCRSFVDGVDDLVVVDPAQIRRDDPEVGVPELALDHEQRDPFAGHLDGVRVAEWMGREPTPQAGCPSRLV